MHLSGQYWEEVKPAVFEVHRNIMNTLASEFRKSIVKNELFSQRPGSGGDDVDLETRVKWIEENADILRSIMEDGRRGNTEVKKDQISSCTLTSFSCDMSEAPPSHSIFIYPFYNDSFFLFFYWRSGASMRKRCGKGLLWTPALGKEGRGSLCTKSLRSRWRPIH